MFPEGLMVVVLAPPATGHLCEDLQPVWFVPPQFHQAARRVSGISYLDPTAVARLDEIAEAIAGIGFEVRAPFPHRILVNLTPLFGQAFAYIHVAIAALRVSHHLTGLH